MAFGRDLPHSFKAALELAKKLLQANHALVERNTVDTEAEQIVIAAFRRVTGKSLTRMELFSRMEDRLPESVAEHVLTFAIARTEGKPLQYLTGFQVFLDHEYEVGPDVLVPRPETEILAVTAMDELGRGYPPPITGFEVGLGSGVLSIELLSRFPGLKMTASELRPEAGARALKNATRILGASGLARLHIVRATDPLSVWEPFQDVDRADFLISNPPYLTATDPIDEEVRKHEPWAALFAPENDPLYFYREIASRAKSFLKEKSSVFLEIPHPRAQAILDLFLESGFSTRLVKDLTGRDRVLVATVALNKN